MGGTFDDCVASTLATLFFGFKLSSVNGSAKVWRARSKIGSTLLPSIPVHDSLSLPPHSLGMFEPVRGVRGPRNGAKRKTEGRSAGLSLALFVFSLDIWPLSLLKPVLRLLGQV